jgi:primosomal protein N'
MRAPRHVNAFDYAIPDGMDIRVGDLVNIPFRSRMIVGLIRSVAPHPSSQDVKLKEIAGPHANLSLTNETLNILTSLAARSFSSQSSILHAWLGNLPKRPSSPTTPGINRTTEQPNNRITEHILLPNHLPSLINLIKEIISLNKKLLILTPWASRADWIAEQLGTGALTSNKAAGKRAELWMSFIRNERQVLITTRLGAWLAAEADIIILDEPENDDHKQDELSPRYDARWIAEAAHALGRPLIKLGLTPQLVATPINVDIPRKEKHANPPTREPANIPTLSPSLIPIDINRSDWSNITGLQNRTLIELERAVREERDVIIIHPIHGERARLRCKDCSWQADCTRCGAGLTVKSGELICLRCHLKEAMNLTCPVCNGSQLSKSRAGRDKLERDLRQAGFDTVRVYSIGEWNAMNKIPAKNLLILTDLSLFSGGVEDLRKKERLMIAFRRLADTCASADSKLLIQADAMLLTEAKSWLTGEGCTEAFKAEWKERELFRLPPAFRLLKIIFRGNEGYAIRQINMLKERVRSEASFAITGPFPVIHRPSNRAPRWIGHVSAPAGTKTEAFEQLIRPLLDTNTIFDLDPIAFFE